MIFLTRSSSLSLSLESSSSSSLLSSLRCKSSSLSSSLEDDESLLLLLLLLSCFGSALMADPGVVELFPELLVVAAVLPLMPLLGINTRNDWFSMVSPSTMECDDFDDDDDAAADVLESLGLLAESEDDVGISIPCSPTSFNWRRFNSIPCRDETLKFTGTRKVHNSTSPPPSNRSAVGGSSIRFGSYSRVLLASLIVDFEN
mmetsp:Transcript_1846/g.4261  ORF Transcript_1846/g.4261 Transcript_1846/m.4261 type:complete len:202 (+) Transcript_1846:737-1342(+)